MEVVYIYKNMNGWGRNLFSLTNLANFYTDYLEIVRKIFSTNITTEDSN